MPATIRPNRIEITDRFPMLTFTLFSPEGPRSAEVVIASHLTLFTKPEGRNSGNFYSSREHGPLLIPQGGAIYTVPPSVVARFISADQLYFALATASPPTGQDWRVDVMPSDATPFVSLKNLSDRALRRVRMFPSAVRGRERPALTQWAGDLVPAVAAAPASSGAAPAVSEPARTPVAPGPYNDGFGPLPPLRSEAPAAATPAPAASAPIAPNTAAAASLSYARGLEDEGPDPDTIGIDGPVLDGPETATAAGLARTSPLTTPDYPGARLMPSPAFSSRRGKAIDCVVIHITGAPQSRYLGSHFTRPDANTSSHYMIDQNGAILQFVREQDSAWHARSANSHSIGIEHVAIQRGGARYGQQTFPYTPPTDVELTTSAQLVAHLCRKYSLTPDRTTIIGHREADSGTTHSVCPDGAWDWDDYMTRVATAYAATPEAGVEGATTVAQGLAAGQLLPAIALDASTISVSTDKTQIASPSVETYSQLRSVAIQALLAANPAFFSTVLLARAAAEAGNLTIGIGPAVSAGLLAGGGLGAGLIFAPGNVMGVYGQVEISAGWIASIGASLQVTIVRGGVDAFRGVSYAAGISGGEGLTGGAAALFNEARDFQGVSLQVGVGVGLSPVDIYTSVQHAIAAQLGIAMALGAGQTVEIKYRAFIPSPAIKGPLSDYDLGPIASGEDFSGDDRTFSYSGGTSRGEITATLTLGADGSISNLRTVDRHWGESKAFDSSYTYHVDGKPDWWMARQAGLEPQRRATLAVSDDNLKIYQGASTTTRSILAVTSQSSVVTVYMAGALPLISPSADIDADISIYLKPGANGVQAMVVGDHDGFPCHELYINGQAVHLYDPVAAGKGPQSLLPPSDIDVSTDWINIPAMATASGQALSYAASAGSAPISRAMVFGQEDFDKIRRLRAGDWRDLFQWRDPDSIRTRIESRGFHIQNIEDAVGDLNLDFYKVRIDRMPPGLDGPTLLSQFIRNISGFVDSDICKFDPYDGSDATLIASDDPVGACMNLDINAGAWAIDPRGWDDAAIVISSKGPVGQPTQFYSVTTINTPKTGDHPVSGHRQFGFYTDGGATYFYTRGADRATLAFPGTEGSIYAGGERLWQSFQRVVSNYINLRGGSATIVPPFSERFNPSAISLEFNGWGQPSASSQGLSRGMADTSAQATADGPAQAQVEDRCRPQFSMSPGAVAQSLDAEDWSINWDEVESIAQPTDMGCWATSAAMITGWKNKQSVDPTLLARYNSLEPSMQTGISARDTASFVPAIGFEFAPAACYTPEGFRYLIENHGPLFIVARVPSLHAIVVTGMYRKDGQYFVRITDPWDRIVGDPGVPGSYANTHSTGSRYIMSYDAFAAEYEAASGFGDNQIAFSKGQPTGVPNRGSTTPPGYAFAAGEEPAPPAAQAPAAPAAQAPATAAPAPVASAAPNVPAEASPAPEITRQTSSEDGRSYDLAQLRGMVRPPNALAGATLSAMPGERVLLSDWPYIEEEGSRTQANLSIDWKFDGAGVGDIVIAPAGGSVANGRTVAVRADIVPGSGGDNKTVMLVRVRTTFTKAGEADQSARIEVTLAGDGRSSRELIPEQDTAAAPAPAEATPPKQEQAAPKPEPVMA